MNAASEFRAGDVVDRRYVLKREVSRGGMAVIFEAEHVHTGRRVAIKGLLEEPGQDASARRRLLQEGRALARCRDRHVVEVLDVGLDGERPFLALELLEGRALDGLLATRGRLPLPVAVEVLTELCRALSSAHRVGVLHRDIKPGNLFLARQDTGRERVKLLDFGIAHLPSAEGGDRITRVGERMGTREYMAFEQLLTLPLDRRADLFSAMVVFFECVTGRLPFAEMRHETAPWISSLVTGLPPALDAVVARGLARDREARFDSASEMAAAVRLAAGVVAPTSLLDPPTAVEGGQPRTFRRAPYVTPCRATGSHQILDGRTADVSEGGLLVLFGAVPPLGRPVRLRFCLPVSGRAITVEAIPRWHRAARALVAVGLEFVELPAEGREEILTFVGLMGQSRELPRPRSTGTADRITRREWSL